ncbi:MAG: hypothetical protein U9R41_05725 [Candidatus Marinimicrobia bacterium]|nr:hypothetical protein [Candidatus Neomarinimicrobiota bacterium]
MIIQKIVIMLKIIFKKIFILLFVYILFFNILFSQELGIDTYSKYLTFSPHDREVNTIYPKNWISFGECKFPKDFDSTYTFLKWVQADYASSEVLVKYRPITRDKKLMFASEWLNYKGASPTDRFGFWGKLVTDRSVLNYSRINFHPNIQVSSNLVKYDLITHNLSFDHNYGSKYLNLFGSLKMIDVNKKNIDSTLIGHHFYTVSKLGNSFSLGNLKFNILGENIDYWYDDEYEYLWDIESGLTIDFGRITANAFAKYYSNDKIYTQMNIIFKTRPLKINLFYQTKKTPFELNKYFSDINFMDKMIGGEIELNISNRIFDIKYSGSIYSQLNNSNSIFYQNDSLILVEENKSLFSNEELFASINFNYFKIFSQFNYNFTSNFNYNFYHPDIIDLHTGIKSKFKLFDRNLLVNSRVEGMYQYHRYPNDVKFNSALLRYIPIYQSDDFYSGNWTMNAYFSGTVQTFTIELQVRNILNSYVYSAQNVFPNQRFTQVTVYWSWKK